MYNKMLSEDKKGKIHVKSEPSIIFDNLVFVLGRHFMDMGLYYTFCFRPTLHGYGLVSSFLF